jgi:hypothetical protein
VPTDPTTQPGTTENGRQMMNRGRFTVEGRFKAESGDPDVMEKKRGGGCLVRPDGGTRQQRAGDSDPGLNFPAGSVTNCFLFYIDDTMPVPAEGTRIEKMR